MSDSSITVKTVKLSDIFIWIIRTAQTDWFIECVLDKLFILTVMYSNNCDLGTRSKQDIDNGRKMIVLYCMVYPDFILVIA